MAAGLLLVLFRLRPALKHTTLPSAGRWLFAGLLLWGTAWGLTTLTSVVSPPVADQLWYAVGVVMLCPGIAVLGARRPGNRVWTWFVLIPLLLVLGLPLLVAWTRHGDAVRWELETPVILGYVFVLVMGGGNYLGTRWTGALLLWVAALLLLVVPISPLPPPLVANADQARLWATLLLSAGVLLVWRQAGRPRSAPTAYDRLWLDFRDWFGLVWANRVRERLNQAAANEDWPVRLGWQGIVVKSPPSEGANSGQRRAQRTTEGGPSKRLDREGRNRDGEDRLSAKTAQRLDYNLRWLLRRFVEPEWIETRLQKVESSRLKAQG